MDVKLKNSLASKLRSPYPLEAAYFQANPTVAGMASEDGRIVINPHSGLTEREKQAVMLNEYARLWMRNAQFAPPFQVTPEQREAFVNTPYATDNAAMRQTILARGLSGDPSARNTTAEQRSYIGLLRELLGK